MPAGMETLAPPVQLAFAAFQQPLQPLLHDHSDVQQAGP
jgi:hypothetical protein